MAGGPRSAAGGCGMVKRKSYTGARLSYIPICFSIQDPVEAIDNSVLVNSGSFIGIFAVARFTVEIRSDFLRAHMNGMGSADGKHEPQLGSGMAIKSHAHE